MAKTRTLDAKPTAGGSLGPESSELLRDAKAPLRRRLRQSFKSGQLATCLLFLPPALLLFTLFVIVPILESGWYSFFSWNGYGPVQNWSGFDNYTQVLNDPIFAHSLLNNLFVILVSAFIQLPVAMWIALLISDRTRNSLVFRAIFFLPYILADVVAGLIWKYLYDGDYGLVATIYGWFGQQAPFVLATPGWAMEIFWISHGALYCRSPGNPFGRDRVSEDRRCEPMAGDEACCPADDAAGDRPGPFLQHPWFASVFRYDHTLDQGRTAQYYALGCFFSLYVWHPADAGRFRQRRRSCAFYHLRPCHGLLQAAVYEGAG
jgi:hypothetical protein